MANEEGECAVAAVVEALFAAISEATSWNMSGEWALSRDSRQAREVKITSEEGRKVAVDMPWGRWRIKQILERRLSS
jgi:hypothetical protein